MPLPSPGEHAARIQARDGMAAIYASDAEELQPAGARRKGTFPGHTGPCSDAEDTTSS